MTTSARPYSPERTPADAPAECRDLEGAQFMPAAVAALTQVLAADTAAAPGLRAPSAAL